jgi:hypothetical protein
MDAPQCGQLAGGYVHVSLPFQVLPHRGHPDLSISVPATDHRHNNSAAGMPAASADSQ